MGDIVKVKTKYESRLLKIRGVVGVGASINKGCIVVYVESSDVCRYIPKELEGYKVVCEVVGRVRV